jgi:hypothetical protein
MNNDDKNSTVTVSEALDRLDGEACSPDFLLRDLVQDLINSLEGAENSKTLPDVIANLRAALAATDSIKGKVEAAIGHCQGMKAPRKKRATK